MLIAMSQMRFILFVAASAFTAFTANADIINCGKNALFTITELGQTPSNSISAGENLTLTLKYTTPIEIDDGIAKTAVTLNYLPFAPTSESLCLNTPCPLFPGYDYDGSVSAPLPSGINGLLITQITWTDLNGKQLLCIKSTIQASGYSI